MEDEGAELLMDSVEAAILVASDGAATFTRVTGVAEHTIIVHLPGKGRYQIDVKKEAA